MKKQIQIIFILMLVTMGGCVKTNLTDLNVNPDQPLSTNPNYVFNFVLQQGMGNYGSDVTMEQWNIMNWMMFMAERDGMEPGKEYRVPGGKDAFWREQFTNTLSNAQLIVDMADEDPTMVNMKAAAEIWQVYIFQIITDLWGYIPYSEALKGMTENELTPAYDSQQDIYLSLIDKLQSATTAFDPSEKFFDAESDMVYDGDMQQWQKFGYSLLLRVATRVNQVEYDTYAGVIEYLKDKPLFTSQDNAAVFPFNSVRKNHLWETMFRNESTVQNNPSKFFVDMVVEREDPRAKVYFEAAPLSFLPFIDEYKGVPNLLPNNSTEWENYNLNNSLGVEGEWGDISKIGEWFLNNDTPGVIMNYSEVCFLLAEASLNGLWDEDATELLKQGVRASMEFYNLYANEDNMISESEIDTYLATITEATLEEIITQKWLTFAYEQGFEAYAEYRRIGYPQLVDYFDNPVSDEAFPKRIPYPYSEYTLNNSNYNNAIENQGPDDEFTKLWWDN